MTTNTLPTDVTEALRAGLVRLCQNAGYCTDATYELVRAAAGSVLLVDPADEPCDACNADAGEICDPFCLGVAASTDVPAIPDAVPAT